MFCLINCVEYINQTLIPKITEKEVVLDFFVVPPILACKMALAIKECYYSENAFSGEEVLESNLQANNVLTIYLAANPKNQPLSISSSSF
jgi:hypothetical protein